MSNAANLMLNFSYRRMGGGRYSGLSEAVVVQEVRTSDPTVDRQRPNITSQVDFPSLGIAAENSRPSMAPPVVNSVESRARHDQQDSPNDEESKHGPT